MIEFQCPQCAQQYSVSSGHAGKLIRCKTCQTQVRIPTGDYTAAQVPAPNTPTAQASGARPQSESVSPQTPIQPGGGATDLDQASALAAPQMDMLEKNLVYLAAADIGSIQNDMESLRNFDRYHEQKQKKNLTLMWISILVLAGLGISAYALIVNNQTAFGIVCVLGAAGGLVGAIITGVNYNKHAYLNLDDKRYECMNEFLRLIAVDAAHNEPFTARLKFGVHDRQDAFVKNGKVGYWDAKFYVNEWFNLSGKLKDGSRFSIAIKEKQQNRSRTKRSMSGKLKHKSKVKNAEEIVLLVRPKEKRYPDLVNLVQDAPQALQIPGYAELKSFSFQQSAIVLKIAIRGTCQWRSGNNVNNQVRERVNLLAMTLLSVYQMLNLSREIHKKAG